MNARTRPDSPAARAGCAALVRTCADLRDGMRALVLTDARTRAIGALLAAEIETAGGTPDRRVLPPADAHGREPPDAVARAMAAADVIFGLTTMSMAHTRARQRASEAGVRYLSLPDYSLDVLASPALQADFRALTGLAERAAGRFTSAARATLTGPDGTDVTFDLRGRTGNAAPGWCCAPGVIASPPDAEANVAVVETGTEGTLVVNGSIAHPGFGRLAAPLRLRFRAGVVVAVQGRGAGALQALLDGPGDPRAQIAAELGIGLNPRAVLGRSMLEDEGCRGTVHVGIGANVTIGGENDVPFHVDHVVQHGTLRVGDITLIENGVLAENAV